MNNATNDALYYPVGRKIEMDGETCTIFFKPWLEMDGTVSMGVKKPNGTKLKLNVDRYGKR